MNTWRKGREVARKLKGSTYKKKDLVLIQGKFYTFF